LFLPIADCFNGQVLCVYGEVVSRTNLTCTC
jgi:hypothetical protein